MPEREDLALRSRLPSAVRTVGIEEELLLVDAVTGGPLAVADSVVGRAPGHLRDTGTAAGQEEPRGHVGRELQQQQLEIDTAPHVAMEELEHDLRAWRAAVGEAALELGARVVASGTSPLPVRPLLTDDPRYGAIVAEFGLTAREQLVCGCHVHVGVSSDEEGVAVLDRIGPWLPALLALSANSPYSQGEDTGYASFRSQAGGRWPSSGPTGRFGSARRYHRLVGDLVASGVLLDRRMVYFDARLSATYPTVEVRIADVCLQVEDAALVAALCRGLVDTAAADWVHGRELAEVPTELLRMARWRAGHDGVDGHLLDAATGRPRPASEVLHDLVEHVRPALLAAGDLQAVERGVEAVLRRGTGARRQRSVGAAGDLAAVVEDLAALTLQ